jgi:hypothetical protein
MRALVIEAKREPKPGYVLSEFEKRTGWARNGSKVWKDPDFKVADIPIPKPSPKQVLIKIRACGVCGSDVHMYHTDEHNYILFPGNSKFPCTPGHEFSGEIVEVGSEVSKLRKGDLVTAEEMNWCGECDYCKLGYLNQCENLEEIGFTIQGAFAEYIAVHEKYCWKINRLAEYYGDQDKGLEMGAVVEPSSVAYNAIFSCAGGIKPGNTVVVYGAGPIGLASIGLTQTSGAYQVITFEPSPRRRELAKSMGADHVFNPAEGPESHERVLDLTDGKGADMHIEAAGNLPKIMPQILKSLAVGAKIVQIGMGPLEAPITAGPFQFKKATLYGGIGHSGYNNFANVIKLMSVGKLDMSNAITSRFGLNEVIEAIVQSGKLQDGKVLVKPEK